MILMFCGTGGTGKTTLFKEMAKDLNFTPPPSFTREAYSLLGIENESASYNLSNDKKIELQKFIFDYCLTKVESLSELNKDSNYVFERSPIDHLAYAASTLKGVVGQDYFNVSFNRAKSLLEKIKPIIVYFPYPAPWSNSTSVEDSFRLVDSNKDSKIAENICNLLPLFNVNRVSMQSFDLEDRKKQLHLLLTLNSIGKN